MDTLRISFDEMEAHSPLSTFSKGNMIKCVRLQRCCFIRHKRSCYWISKSFEIKNLHLSVLQLRSTLGGRNKQSSLASTFAERGMITSSTLNLSWQRDINDICSPAGLFGCSNRHDCTTDPCDFNPDDSFMRQFVGRWQDFKAQKNVEKPINCCWSYNLSARQKCNRNALFSRPHQC